MNLIDRLAAVGLVLILFVPVAVGLSLIHI